MPPGKTTGPEHSVAVLRSCLILAAGEGFEPSQTESESVVLPLHNPAIDPTLAGTNAIIANALKMSRGIFNFFPGNIFYPSRRKKRKRVVWSYRSPAFRVAEGNPGWLGVSGKCWVSRQKPWRKP